MQVLSDKLARSDLISPLSLLHQNPYYQFVCSSQNIFNAVNNIRMINNALIIRTSQEGKLEWL